MIKKTVTYEDFDGNQVTEDLYFNFTKTDLIKMDLQFDGMEDKLKKIVAAGNNKEIYDTFEEIVLKSYGIKDGLKFRKSEEITRDFKDSLAFDALMMDLLTTQTNIEDFIKGVIPKVD